MESLGQRLKHFRLERGYSATTVARRLGISVSTYRRWEAGGVISGEPYVKLIKILGVSLNDLFGMPASRRSLKEDIQAIEVILDRMRGYS